MAEEKKGHEKNMRLFCHIKGSLGRRMWDLSSLMVHWDSHRMY